MLWFLSNWCIRPEGAQSGLRCNAQNGYIIKSHNMPDYVIYKKTRSQNAGFAAHFWKSVKKRLVLSRKMHGKVLKTAEILHEKCRPCRVRAERPSASKRKADQKSVTDFSGLGIRNKMPRMVSRRKNRGFPEGESPGSTFGGESSSTSFRRCRSPEGKDPGGSSRRCGRREGAGSGGPLRLRL